MKLRRIVSAMALTGATALILTGCMSYKMDVSVNEDKTANVQFSAGYDKAKMKQLLSYDTESGFGGSGDTAETEDVCASLQEQAASSGEASMSDKITWSETEKECVATVLVENVPFDETGLSETKELSEVADGVEIKAIGDSAQFVYSTASLQESLGADSQNSMVSWDAILTDFDVTVSFPGEVSEANFDGVISEDKRSVAWNIDSLKLALDEGGNLEATGALSAPVNILPFVIGGVLLLVVIGGAAAFFAFRRKDDNTSNGHVADDAAATETTANPVI